MPEASSRRLILAPIAVMAALLNAPVSAQGKALDPSRTASRDFWVPKPELVRIELVKVPGSSLAELHPLQSSQQASRDAGSEKRFPAMRLVKSGCEFFPRLVSVSQVRGLGVHGGAGAFSRRPFFPLECRRTSGKHSLLSARLLARKAPGDLFGSRKKNAVSSSKRTSQTPMGIFRRATFVTKTRR